MALHPSYSCVEKCRHGELRMFLCRVSLSPLPRALSLWTPHSRNSLSQNKLDSSFCWLLMQRWWQKLMCRNRGSSPPLHSVLFWIRSNLGLVRSIQRAQRVIAPLEVHSPWQLPEVLENEVVEGKVSAETTSCNISTPCLFRTICATLTTESSQLSDN